MFKNFHSLNALENDAEFMPVINIETDTKELEGELPDALPVLPLKNTVLFPGVVIPITVGRDKSLKAVQEAYAHDKLISVHTQRDPQQEDPAMGDLYAIGTVAKIMKIIKMPDGNTTAILQGKSRVRFVELVHPAPYIRIRAEKLDYRAPADEMEFQALVSSMKDTAREIIELSPNIPSEAVLILKNIDDNLFLMNFIASNLNVAMEVKQQLLEVDDLMEKGQNILTQLNHELQLLELKDKIEGKVRQDIEKQQRDYFLNQQLKTIQEELGQNPVEMEVLALTAKAEKKKWPARAKELFEKELDKLKRINPQFGEYSIQLNYINFILDLPWDEQSKDNFDLAKSARILDEDHYGLRKVKERILEHLAVLKLRKDMKAPILCLVGPPGVGKTSLGKSIARSLNRQYVRMSLGGLHDESEIRGHRKTYIGAMPGRILQSLKKAGKANPVFILDEIDKLGRDFRGDPSSALLEVLDPEQNNSFYDNYLETEYDLSKVLFIATANSLNTIQPALLDRMEIIDLSGYALEEKVEIARRHLIPENLKEHGLKPGQFILEDDALRYLIHHYTRESGVRTLNRKIGDLMRRVSKHIAMKESYQPAITVEEVKAILGIESFKKEAYEDKPLPGVAVGLAWTAVGGDILYIEAIASKGKGKLTLTGNLGDVMKESAQTALSFIKANASALKLQAGMFEEIDLHIHVPEGAIPKDGPSAGITMLTAIASALCRKPVRPFLAMTGEITLRGKVLPVGGIKEKILAAKRSGITSVLLCEENRRHVEEIEPSYIEGLEFIYVEKMEEVLLHAIGIWDFN
jgi:ATP-dependent Lon protease